MTIEQATSADLGFVAQITTSMRRQLATWDPTYFNPSDGADELHAGFLGFILGSEDHVTRLLVADGQRVGFFVEVHQESQRWIDDLCLDDAGAWPRAVEAISGSIAEPWVTCVSSADTVRGGALTSKGAETVSSYWALSTDGISPAEIGGEAIVDFDPSLSARHTFGGRAFDPDTPGALIVGSPYGHVVGSPSMTPPIYNPGGPTTVIDQITGKNRRHQLHQALAIASGRGDSQVIVVCRANDHDLTDIIAGTGFRRVVDLIET